ncbi:hypothetical protein G6O69_18230 [Pseudenhygromyxa sp. WMMC2535]|uniref:M66 family metalloprotease n=1 Tax=Pseudenhygromyxa sp. WMMC2535 TaxID=2712867 RepID=UPI001555F2FC|nr:M66 family metalloprotease [Pseudenhygromyxa sp. WMMC2535]NVB39788.1 hypothetical protein [Pseudenhygromyxa sp. WMMC2535]
MSACSDDSTAGDDALESTGGDEIDSTAGEGESAGESAGESGGGEGESGGGESGEDTDDTGGSAEPFVPFDEADWAHGDISIERVEVNQGVAITVVENGELVPADQRPGLVKDRNALIQAFWSVPANWQPRPILAKLHVRETDGTLRTYEVTKTIEGEPSQGSLAGALTWQLPADNFQGNLEFFIELWEAEDPGSVAASSASPSTPSGGMQPIGVTDEPMEVKLWMVPVQYANGNCVRDTTETLTEEFDTFTNYFFSQNPIHTLNVAIHEEPLVVDFEVTTLSQINNMLVTRRFQDFADPNEYYFALLDACTGGIDGAGGLSPGTPMPLKGLGDLRVSTGLLASVEWSKGAFVHELGHNQGRPHSPCGDPDGPDPNYPYDGATIGVYGFDVLTGQWYPPTRKDYMSYCTPTWVSDWTWAYVHEQVRQLTSWDYEGKSGDEDFNEILHGWVHPSGEQSWWTSAGELPPEMLSVAESVAFYDGEGELIAEQPAASWVLDDDKTRYFMAEVPDSELDLVAEIVRVSKDVPSLVPRAEVVRRYDSQFLAPSQAPASE